MRRNGLLPALGIVLAVGSLAATPEITLLTREVSLGKVGPGLMVMLESVTVSADSNRVAYAARRGPKQLVVVDGVEGKEYDGIAKGTPVFSPDGKRVAFVAKRGDKQFTVVDGVEGTEYDAIGTAIGKGTLVFSPDSRRVGYVARRGGWREGKQLVVLDGVEGKEYGADAIGEGPIFSQDGRRVVYVACTNRRCAAWLMASKDSSMTLSYGAPSCSVRTAAK